MEHTYCQLTVTTTHLRGTFPSQLHFEQNNYGLLRNRESKPLIYVDDLKLVENSDEELAKQLKIVEHFNEYIKMEFLQDDDEY